MLVDLYTFDLNRLDWTLLASSSASNAPQPRLFPSFALAEAAGLLYVYAGDAGQQLGHAGLLPLDAVQPLADLYKVASPRQVANPLTHQGHGRPAFPLCGHSAGGSFRPAVIKLVRHVLHHAQRKLIAQSCWLLPRQKTGVDFLY